jgi:hypothetical protein
MDNKMNKEISLKTARLNMYPQHSRFYRSLLLVGLMLVVTSAALTVNAASAPTLSFAWYPSTITSGQSTHREWSTTNADSCIGNNGSSVGTSGISKQNVQTSSKTVTMTCYGPGGSVSRSASLTVLPPAPSTPGRPSGPSNVTTNQSFTISWSSVSGATSYRLYKNGSSAYSGSGTGKSQSISSPGSNSYTVKACNSSGCSATSSSRTVTVASPPPIPTLSFGWYPSTIISGETTHREWNTTNADTCIGDNGSSVGISGVSQENVQTVGKTVTMTCSGPGGSVSKSITLTVLPPIPSTPGRPSGSSNVTTNQSFTISWSSVSGATSYQLYKNGSSAYSGSSTSKSQSISSPGSNSYTVKACNSTGCSAASLSRTVIAALPPAPTLSFAWYPSTIVEGETTHREWSTTNADSCIGDNGSSVGTSGVSQENVHTVNKTVTMTCYGAGGEVSKTITLTVNSALPDRVTTVLGPNEAEANTLFSISWDAMPNTDTYTVLVKSGAAGEAVYQTISGVSGTSLDVSHNAEEVIIIRVQACNVSGCGPESGARIVNVLAPPPLPDRVTTVLGPNKAEANTPFTISWDAMPNTDTYTVLVKSGASGEGVYQKIEGVGGTSIDISHNAEEVIIIRVQACNVSGCGPESGARIVNVSPPPQPLGTAVLNSPGLDQTLANGMPCFDWDTATSAEYYTVQVSSDTNFDQYSQRWVSADLSATEQCWDATFIANTTAGSTPSSLALGQTFYWRIKSMDKLTSAGPTATFSAPRAFIVPASSLGTAVLNSPTEDQTLVNGMPCFDWDTATSAEYYTVQVSNDTNFDQDSQRWVAADLTTTEQCWDATFIANATAESTPTSLALGQTFYWRIKSMDKLTSAGPTATFSAPRVFTVPVTPIQWAATIVVVGQNIVLQNADAAIIECQSASNSAVKVKVGAGVGKAYAVSETEISDWQCFDSQSNLVLEFNGPLSIEKLAKPLNLKVQNNE